MPTPERGGKLPDCAGLRFLRDRGWSYADFEAEYGVTNQSVHRKMSACGLVEPHVDYSPLIPWKIAPEHRNQNINVLLRAAARQRLSKGRKLTPRKQRELDNWLAKLDRNNAVVGYGSHLNPEGDREFGFYYAEKRPGIDLWLIREPMLDVPADDQQGTSPHTRTREAHA